MSEFKIESNIPIPEDAEEIEVEEPEDILPEEEPSRWTPYKPNQRKCPNNQHWPMIGKCQKCGDIFPCPSGNCGHFDCANPELAGLDCEGNGTEVPEFLNVIDSESGMARADSGTVEISEEGSNEEELLD